MDQQKLSTSQFGANAAYYLASPVHATGADLERLGAAVADYPAACALDLGCGGGHASYALARGGARQVIAYDPSSEMLAVVAREAERRGHGTIETRLGAAEVLPFESNTFNLVVTRFSAHHWANVPQALAECARVMVAGGRLIVIDAIAPETPILDTSLQVIEFLRDASHVRDYRISEWREMQKAAGFGDSSVTTWKLPMEFQSWIARIGTPPARVAALEAVFRELPSEVRDYFRVDPSGSFFLDAAWIEARKVDGAAGVSITEPSGE